MTDASTASWSQRDPSFEFNAPRWYNFERLNECLPSPTADADAYFTSSQVKGLRTPTRDSAAEQDGDLNKMQMDLERVRQEMRDEATSASSPNLATPDCPSPCPEEEQADAMDEEQDEQEAAPEVASAPLEEEEEPASLPQRSEFAEADGEAQYRSSGQLATETAEHLPQQVQEQAAAAQQHPAPWPMPPRLAGETAGKKAPEETASDQPNRRPPSNLVTSWGPSAPGKKIMAHTAPRPPLFLGAAGDKERTSQIVVAASGPAKASEGGSTAAAEPPRQDRRSGTQEAAAVLRRSPRLTPPKEAAAAQQGLRAKPAVQAKASSRQAQKKPLPKKASGQQEGPQPADKAAGKSSGARPLTKPKSPKLGTSTRRQLIAGLTGRTVAKQLDQERNVQRGGKAGPSAPSQAPRLKAAATAAGSKRPTRPVSPDLRTSKRQRASAAGPLPQEQDEWKPLALMVAQFEAATPARFNNAGPRAVHYVPPPPPHPSDKAPELAVDSRVRPTHYKPHVEREMEEIASMPAFKAQPVNPAVMNSHGQLGVTHVPPKPTTTGHAPVLATEKRAAAHPKPAEEQPQPPLKPAPAFDPLRLTKAHSPKLATTMRTRSKSMAPAPDGPAFVFKAQPALGPSGPAKVSKPSRSRRHTTTSFQPFHLSTEERGGAKQSALEKAAAAKRAAEAAVPAFRAAPVPPTLRQRARLPPVPEKAPTAPEPFHLISEARHREAVLQQEMQNEARSAKRHREATFKAAPAPAHPRPRPPRPSRQPLTAAQTPDLALRSRSVARAAFDAAVAEKERRAEEAKKLEEERAAEEEAKEIKRLRKTLVFKARPAPGHGIALYDPRVPIVQQSPFQNTRSRSRLPR